MSAKKLYAIAYFANQYHSGFKSRGYRLLCMAQRALKRKGLFVNLSSNSWVKQSDTYKTLVQKYGDKI